MFSKKNNNKQEKVQEQAKQVQKSASKAAKNKKDAKWLILEPGTLEYAVLNQAEQINWLKRRNTMSYAAILFCLFVIFIKQDTELPPPTYFAQSPDGGYREIKPMSEPFTNTVEMRSWAEECIMKSLDISFSKKLNTVNNLLNECYSGNGKVEYTSWLLSGKSKQKIKIPNGDRSIEISADSEFAQIVDKKISMSASKIAPARIKEIKAKVIKGESFARWDLQIPIVLEKLEGLEKRGHAKYTVKVELIRTTDQSKLKGVSLDSWTLVRG